METSIYYGYHRLAHIMLRRGIRHHKRIYLSSCTLGWSANYVCDLLLWRTDILSLMGKLE